MIDLEVIPKEIRESTRAVVWRYEERDGKPTKVPYIVTKPGVRAKVNDPNTWGPFSDAVDIYHDGKADGPGIVLGDGLVGVDLDDCRNPETGVIEADAAQIIRDLNSYTEVSPSGTGVKVFMHGTLPAGSRRKGNVEMYSEDRYFTLLADTSKGHQLLRKSAQPNSPRCTLVFSARTETATETARANHMRPPSPLTSMTMRSSRGPSVPRTDPSSKLFGLAILAATTRRAKPISLCVTYFVSGLVAIRRG